MSYPVYRHARPMDVPLSPSRGQSRGDWKIGGSNAEEGLADSVAAVFADNSADLFRLPDLATLGDVAAELVERGIRHGGAPLYVRVTLRRPSQRAP